MKLENLIRQLADKKIVVLGFGKEGMDNYLALRKLFPEAVFGIADKKKIDEFSIKEKGILLKDKKLIFHLGHDYLNEIGDYDLVLKTPGIPNNIVKKHSGKNSIITTQTEIFFENFKGKIIGVTGTKGKGTTSSLIYSILKSAGIKCYLVGNIGAPVFMRLLKAKESDVFIYELSSHQLASLKKSPHIAVFLNLFQDHLDYYKDFEEYKMAKVNIFKYQTENDFLIYSQDDKNVLEISKMAKSKKIRFGKSDVEYLSKIIPLNKIPLKGEFNYLNVVAAIKAVKILGVGDSYIKKGIMDFNPLPHRLEFVGEFNGIKFYDNSMATIPQTTILDLKTFNGNPISLIIGGSDKGSDYSGLAKEISKTSVKNLIILGQGTGQEVARQVPSGKLPSKFLANTMEEAVKICFKETPKNGICLLSPASASFNMFRDYKHRGNLFKQNAKRIAPKTK